MANFQYKSSSAGSWADVPQSAYHGTLAGMLDVVYPTIQDYTIDGRACGAVGLPYIIMQSQIMSASGLQFWMSQFAASDLGDIEFWLTAYDTRTGNWGKYSGWLLRPTYRRVQIGSGSHNTIYNNIEIIMAQTASEV